MSEIVLTREELERIIIIEQVISKHLTQEEGGKQLGLSQRQVRRIVKKVRQKGHEGVKAEKQKGNRGFEKEFKERVVTIMRKEMYKDFGPTFASEILKQEEGLKINKETLRQWMIEEGLWTGRKRKKARIHQSRERRPCFGELIQIDGSHHRWFEDRASACCLLVAIDDATSKLIGLHFAKSETTLGYMELMFRHFITYGRPIAYYSDRHSIFKTTRYKNADAPFEDTQVQRALRELRVELICAYSPQAKGRVERSNQTLQDRLVKQLRLKKISTIEEANVYALEFIKEHNAQFSVCASNSKDEHRPLRMDEASLKRILSIQETKTLSKNLQFSLDKKIYRIKTKTTGYRLRNKKVDVYKHMDGSLEIVCGSQLLEWDILEERCLLKEADSKEINALVDEIKDSQKKQIYALEVA